MNIAARFFVAALLILVIAPCARADDLARARAVEYTGLALTCVGSALTIGGGVLAPSITGDSSASAEAGTTGIILVSAGLPLATVGTIMWIVGGVQERRARRALGVSANGLLARF